MKRTVVVDLTEDSPTKKNEPLWKRAKFYQEWEPPTNFPETCQYLMELQHSTKLTVSAFYRTTMPYGNDCFHPNFWMDQRHSVQTRCLIDHEKPDNSLVWDLIFKKTLEIYAELGENQYLLKIRSEKPEQNRKYARNVQDLIPMPVIIYLCNPEIIRCFVEEFYSCKFICSDFSMMFHRYAWKPTVSTPYKF